MTTTRPGTAEEPTALRCSDCDEPIAECVVFQMAEVAVPKELFRGILDRIAALRPAAVARC